ncbi:MAG: serine/threonine protein kinase [Gemmatimonadota bacterium]|nr:serine/threonine protein kinase [Gemmatimonadota bacterium]
MKTCTVCGAEWSDETRFCPNDGTTLRAAEGPDLIGAVIADRYHIQEKLGEGGMGAVYLGEHVKMGRKSAIKVMAQSMANDPEAIARFNREAANAARINHPNVCAIYDFGETPEGIIYLAMEYIEGESLSDVLHRGGVFAPSRAATIVQQTAEALQAAHELGIVHRDLKPDNIMIARGRGGGDMVKVVDFGIAKAMTGEEEQKVTKTGLVVGTPEYMSPEQLSGDVLDGRSDVYSLALVFFRMLTGTLPFQAYSAQEMMIKRLTDKPLRLNEAQPEGQFPDRLQLVIDKALERMPGDRYASAVTFATEARESVRGMTSPAVASEAATQFIGTDTTEQVPRTRVSRPPEAPTLPTPAPLPSPASSGKKRPIAAIAGAVAVIAVGGGTAAAMLSMLSGDDGVGPSAGAEDTTSASVALGSDSAGDLGTVVIPAADSGAGEREDSGVALQSPPVSERPGGGEPSVVPLDTAAVRQRLIALGRQIRLPSARANARREAEDAYRDAGLPAILRALAASLMAESYDEDNDNRPLEACRWIANAIALDPSNDAYRSYQNVMLGCTP